MFLSLVLHFISMLFPTFWYLLLADISRLKTSTMTSTTRSLPSVTWSRPLPACAPYSRFHFHYNSCLGFNGHFFRGEPVLASFVVAKDDGSVGDNWSYKTCKVKLQSNRYHHQTYTQFFTGQMPFLSPNQQCQSTDGEKYHIAQTCSRQAHLGVFQLYLWPLKAPGYLGGWLPCLSSTPVPILLSLWLICTQWIFVCNTVTSLSNRNIVTVWTRMALGRVHISAKAADVAEMLVLNKMRGNKSSYEDWGIWQYPHLTATLTVT